MKIFSGKQKKMILGMFFVFSFFIFANDVDAAALFPGNISTCGELGTGGTYTLTQNISGVTGTCFTVSADGVIIDGAGHTVSGTGDLAVDARAYDSGDLESGANGYTNLLINNITFTGFTDGVDASGNDDPDGNGVAGGYGGDGGVVAIYYSSVGNVRSDGGDSSIYAYGGVGGDINFLDTDLDISDITISALGGIGTSGRNTNGGLSVTYTGNFDYDDLTLSALSFIMENDVQIALAYPGGTWPLIAGTISSCGTLFGSGTYVLASDIGTTTAPVSGTCFNIASNNITIDGAGHTVYSTSTNSSFAVSAGNYASTTLSNITFSGYSNLINSSSTVMLSGGNIDVSDQRINASALTVTYTGTFDTTGATASAFSSFVLNGVNYGATGAGNFPTWFARTAPGNKNWGDITSSADGKRLAAGISGSYIFTSSDYGMTWTQQTSSGSRAWGPITSSSDGSIIFAAVYNGYIYKSTNYGVSWTQVTSFTSTWSSISVSSDGTHVAALGVNSSLVTSDNGGGSWKTIASVGSKNWQSILVSADGTKIVAGERYHDNNASARGRLYISEDFGDSWTESVPPGLGYENRQIAMSDDGTRIFAAAHPLSSLVDYDGNAYLSTDGGDTWTQVFTATGTEPYAGGVDMSSDGSRIAMVSYTSANAAKIYTSDDYGTTWTENNYFGGTQNWSRLTMSSDGTKIALGIYGGNMYIHRNTSLPLSVDIIRHQSGTSVSNWDPYVSWGSATVCEYSFDGSNWDTVNCLNNGTDISAPESSVTTLYVRGTDGAGNVGTDQKSFTFLLLPIDITYPAVGSTTLYSEWNPVIDWSPSGSGNVVTCEYSYDNFVTTKTADCDRDGNDVLPPSGLGGNRTMYLRSENDEGDVGGTSVSFLYKTGTWVSATAVNKWRDVAVSASGNNLATAVWGSYIQYSTTSGSTWATSTASGARNWTALTSSADGNTLYGTVWDGKIYKATSTGSNFNWSLLSNSATGQWYTVDTSADGQVVAAATQNAAGNAGYVYVSTDGGSTWSQKNSGDMSTAKSWRSVAVDADGSTIVAVAHDDYIYMSTSTGSTWVKFSTSTDSQSMRKNYHSVSSSADGSKILAVANGYDGFYSGDNGATWTMNPAGNVYKLGSDISADGSVMVTADQLRKVWFAFDSTESYGGTWLTQWSAPDVDSIGMLGTAFGSGNGICDINLSADGNKVFAYTAQSYACGRNHSTATGRIYTFIGQNIQITRPTTGTVYSNSWNPRVLWGTATSCEYSYNNSDWTSADCNDTGADIIAPSSFGSATLYLRGSNELGGLYTNQVSFTYANLLSSGTPVSACGTINASGTYSLSGNITGNTGTCFNVTASNVTINGNGYTVTAAPGNASYAVTSGSNANVVLSNITFSGYGSGTISSSSNITYSFGNLDLTNSTTTAGSLSLDFTGVLTTENTFFSALSSLKINGVDLQSMLAGIFDWSDNQINDCTTITEPGTYVLQNDITNAADSCIQIQTDRVIIDGNGKTITAAVGSTGYAIDATNPVVDDGVGNYVSGGHSYSNIALKDINLVDFAGGINAGGADNLGSLYESNDYRGFNGGKVSLYNVITTDIATAVNVPGGSATNGFAGIGGNGGRVIVADSDIGNINVNGGDAWGDVNIGSYNGEYAGGSAGTVVPTNSTIGTVFEDAGWSYIPGCTDDTYDTYNPSATYSDGSCMNYTPGTERDVREGETYSGGIDFYGFSNRGIVEGDANYFAYDASYSNYNYNTGNYGTTTGYASFIDDWGYGGGPYNYGYVGGGANFYGPSVNYGVIDNGSVFNNSAHNDGTVNGGATFTYGGYNNGTVNGGATFGAAWNYDGSYNYGTVNGTSTFYFGENWGTIDGNAIFYVEDGSGGQNYNYGTVTGDALFLYASDNQGTVLGTITALYGCTDPTAINYSPSAINDDGSCTLIGLNSDNPDGYTVAADITFQNGYHNYGTVDGNATFTSGSYNYGTVTGNATFEEVGNLYNYGTVEGDLHSSIDGTYNVGGLMTLTDFSGELNMGSVGGIFYDSLNTQIDGLEFRGSSSVTGSLVASTTIAFYDSSTNGATVISPDVIFNDSSINSGNITGDVVFNGDSYGTGGTITGDAKFNTTHYYTSAPSGGVFVFSSGNWDVSISGTVYGSDDVAINQYIFTGSTYSTKPINGDAIFTDQSYSGSGGTVSGIAEFSTTYYSAAIPADGVFTISGNKTWYGIGSGTVHDSEGGVINTYIFEDTSRNNATFVADAEFHDSSYNSASITGDVNFYDYGYNNSTITGNAVFYNNRPFRIGTVNGTVTLSGTNQTILGTNSVTNFVKQLTSGRDTLYVTSGSVVNISGAFTLRGTDANNLLTVRANTPGSYASINVNGNSNNVNYLRLRDIRNNGTSVNVSDKVVFNDGGNTGFSFPPNALPGYHSFTDNVTLPPTPDDRDAEEPDTDTEPGTDGGDVTSTRPEGGINSIRFAGLNPLNPLLLPKLPSVSLFNDRGGIGATNFGNLLENVRAPGALSLINFAFQFKPNISAFLFAPLPESITTALNKYPKLSSYLSGVGFSFERDLVKANRIPIALTLPEDGSIPPGLFTVTEDGKMLDLYIAGDPVHEFTELVKVYPGKTINVDLIPMSSDDVTGNFHGDDIVFIKNQDKVTISITVPSEPGKYLLTSSAAPMPLTIEVLNPPLPPQPEKISWFRKVLWWLGWR